MSKLRRAKSLAGDRDGRCLDGLGSFRATGRRITALAHHVDTGTHCELRTVIHRSIADECHPRRVALKTAMILTVLVSISLSSRFGWECASMPAAFQVFTCDFLALLLHLEQ